MTKDRRAGKHADGNIIDERSEATLRSSEERLANELDAMKRLHALVSDLLACPDLTSALQRVLRATVLITGAERGYIELVDTNADPDGVMVHQGFESAQDAAAVSSVEQAAKTNARRSSQRCVVADVAEEDAANSTRPPGFRGLQVTPLTSRSGEVLGLLATHHREPYHPSNHDLRMLDLYARQAADFLDRWRHEAELKRSEASFRAIFEATGVAALQMDARTGEIQRANRTLGEILTQDPERLAGQSFADLVEPTDRNQAQQGVARLCSDELSTYQDELRIRRPVGEPLWVFVTVNLVPGTDPPAAVALLYDVTRRKRAEEGLADESRRKDEYLAMLGHELRSPLAAIRGAVELLGIGADEPAQVERACAVLARQTNHVSGLVDGLLEASRIARGKVKLRREVCDLRQLLDELVDDHRAKIHAQGLKLERERSARPLWVEGDRVRLRQVFDNLLGNAVKFTEVGSVTVADRLEGDEVVVCVSDTGAGIDAPELQTIFESFRQATQRGPQSSGLGLGLSVAKGLVALHHGHIEARSAGLGQGSHFYVRLPTTGERPSQAPLAREASDEGVRRILIVEDNQDASDMLSRLLKRDGHEVHVVRDGEAALSHLRSHPTDVVLCDLGLPELDGFGVARAVRAAPELSHLKLIAVTGYGQPRDKRRTASVGFDAHLVKPVETDLLRELIGLPPRGKD